MKKLKYLLFIFIALIGFKMNIKALVCNYSSTQASNMNLHVTIENGKVKNLSSVGILKGEDRYDSSIIKPGNYSKYAKEAISKNECPDYAIYVDRFGENGIFLATSENLIKLNTYLIDIADDMWFYATYIFELIKPEDKIQVTIKYNPNLPNNLNLSEDSVDMKSQTIDNFQGGRISTNTYHIYQYDFLGWRIKNSNGKWLCSDGEYKNDCEGKYYKLSDGALLQVPIEGDATNLELYALWQLSNYATPLTINQNYTGSSKRSYCTGRGYVWNDEYGYCNTDNLLYVKCGDSYDIPNKVPAIISFFVNLLKIATPIILIIVSIITLFKALVASKDDEIKKAKNSLVKKIIASVFVFFVISIVQFVVMKVADSSEKENISSCLSCFLNNDCYNTLYFKTNVAGNYLCTTLDKIQSPEYSSEYTVTCDNYYKQ